MKIVLCTLIEKFEKDISKLEEIDIVGQIRDSKNLEYELKELAKENSDVIIINRYLFENSIDLVKLIKDIRLINKLQRFIIITGKYEKDFIYPLVNIGIYDFIIKDFSISNIKKMLNSPNIEFDFSLYENKLRSSHNNESKSMNIRLPFTKKVIIKSIFKEVITFYSVNSEVEELGLNYSKYLAKNNCKVLFLDYNFMKPMNLKEKSIRDLSYLIENFERTGKVIEVLDICKTIVDKVDVLTSDFNFHDYYHYEDEILSGLVEKLKTYYDYLIVNINPYLVDRATYSALLLADKVYMVSAANNNGQLELTNSYMKLLSERMDVNVDGVIINDYKGNSITSIETEALLSSKVITYINKKTIFKKKFDKEYKKIGG